MEFAYLGGEGGFVRGLDHATKSLLERCCMTQG
jgi:hypothetical protein